MCWCYWLKHLLSHTTISLLFCSAAFAGKCKTLACAVGTFSPHCVSVKERIAPSKSIEMLIVHWENLSFSLWVKWKACLPQCESVIVSQACALIPSYSTWTAFSLKIALLSPAGPDHFVLFHPLEKTCDYRQGEEESHSYLRGGLNSFTTSLPVSFLHYCEFHVSFFVKWILNFKLRERKCFSVLPPCSLSVPPTALLCRGFLLSLAVGFINYAHCISGPLWGLWQTKAETISVSRIYRKALLQLAGLTRRNASQGHLDVSMAQSMTWQSYWILDLLLFHILILNVALRFWWVCSKNVKSLMWICFQIKLLSSLLMRFICYQSSWEDTQTRQNSLLSWCCFVYMISVFLSSLFCMGSLMGIGFQRTLMPLNSLWPSIKRAEDDQWKWTQTGFSEKKHLC